MLDRRGGRHRFVHHARGEPPCPERQPPRRRASSCSLPRARARGSSTATANARPGRPTARTSWATPSATCCSTRATVARCWPRPRPGTWVRPSSAPPTSAGAGRKPRSRRPSPTRPAARRRASVDHTFWLTPGHASEPDSWYAGTSPQGLFRSDDGGVSWTPLPAVNDDPQFREWMGTVQDGTPDGPKLHSIIVDPRDPAHLLLRDVGRRRARVARRRPQLAHAGARPGGGRRLRRQHRDLPRPALRAPVPEQPRPPVPAEPLRHLPARPRGRSGGDTWQRIGRKMPKRVGDIGFPMVVHPRDADTAWVFPMDGTTVWPRTSPGGRPAAYVTRNAGRTWQRLDQGLPDGQAWWTVKRQAMTVDAPAGAGAVPGHHQRRAVDRPRRRRALVEHRAPPARDLRRGSGGAGMKAPRCGC